VVLTSSPYKKLLENKKQSVKVVPGASNKRKLKVIPEPTGKPVKAAKKKSIGKMKSGSKTKSAETDSDAECLYCQELFSKSAAGEKWIECTLCAQWAHVACAVDCGDNFVCDFCS